VEPWNQNVLISVTRNTKGTIVPREIIKVAKKIYMVDSMDTIVFFRSFPCTICPYITMGFGEAFCMYNLRHMKRLKKSTEPNCKDDLEEITYQRERNKRDDVFRTLFLEANGNEDDDDEIKF
jgi:hypothetical protein